MGRGQGTQGCQSLRSLRSLQPCSLIIAFLSRPWPKAAKHLTSQAWPQCCSPPFHTHTMHMHTHAFTLTPTHTCYTLTCTHTHHAHTHTYTYPETGLSTSLTPRHGVPTKGPVLSSPPFPGLPTPGHLPPPQLWPIGHTAARTVSQSTALSTTQNISPDYPVFQVSLSWAPFIHPKTWSTWVTCHVQSPANCLDSTPLLSGLPPPGKPNPLSPGDEINLSFKVRLKGYTSLGPFQTPQRKAVSLP